MIRLRSWCKADYCTIVSFACSNESILLRMWGELTQGKGLRINTALERFLIGNQRNFPLAVDLIKKLFSAEIITVSQEFQVFGPSSLIKSEVNKFDMLILSSLSTTRTLTRVTWSDFFLLSFLLYWPKTTCFSYNSGYFREYWRHMFSI